MEKILDVLYRRKWLILLCFFVVAAVHAYNVSQMTHIYQTSSVVMVDLGRTGPAEVGNVGEDVFLNKERSLGAELYILQSSPRIQQRVESRLRALIEGEHDTESLEDSIDVADLHYPPQGYVRFSPATRSVDAIQMTAYSPNPREAALLANLYAEEYVSLTQDANRTYVTTSREFLEEQETQRQEELRQAERALQAYRSSNTGIALDDGGSYLVSQIAALESRRDEAQIDLQMREAYLESVQDEIRRISPQLADRIASGVERRLQAAQTRLTELEVEREQILVNNPSLRGRETTSPELSPINTEIQQLQQQIRSLSQQYVEEATAVGGLPGGESTLAYIAELRRKATEDQIAVNGLRARLSVINDRLREYQIEQSRIPGQVVQLAALQRKRMHAEQMYQFVVNRLQEARIAEAAEPGYAYVLREARVPLVPAEPHKKKEAVYGAIIGLLLGLGLALVVEKLDNRIYKPDQLQDAQAKLLAVIPDHKKVIKEDFSGQDEATYRGRPVSTSLVSLLSPFSGVAESYRHLRTTVKHASTAGGERVQTLLVTSPVQGDGKTSVASNLAIAIAQAGNRTILIDADLRRPNAGVLFRADEGVTLPALLTGWPGTNPDALETEVENLYLLRGEVIRDPAERLGSPEMKRLLATLRESFDYVIVDSPPVLAATDAAELATQCDGVIVVTSAGTTKEGDLEQTLETLYDVGAPVLGTVMNKFKVQQSFGYKYRYSKYSKYGRYGRYSYGRDKREEAGISG